MASLGFLITHEQTEKTSSAIDCSEKNTITVVVEEGEKKRVGGIALRLRHIVGITNHS